MMMDLGSEGCWEEKDVTLVKREDADSKSIEYRREIFGADIVADFAVVATESR